MEKAEFIGFMLKKIRIFNNQSLKDRILVSYLLLSGIILLGIAAVIYKLLPGNIQFVSLHYNIYTGIDKVGSKNDLWYYLLVGAIFFLINLFFVLRFIKKGDIFNSRLVLGFSLGILSLLFISIIYIIYLNR